MTKTSFCGIFATLFVTTTMVLLASCSQDDDNYDSDMYTLAEMGTRLGGEGGDSGGKPRKKVIRWEKESENTHQPTSLPNPISILSLSCLPNSTSPTLYGEYDTETLTISISNYNGNAQISILTVESGYLMSSATVAVSSESSIDFSLLNYPTSAYYQIFVTLGSDTYYGVFDL